MVGLEDTHNDENSLAPRETDGMINRRGAAPKSFVSESQQRASQQKLDRLSPREKDVLRGVVAGASSRSIAGQLGISIKTIDKHRSNLMRKLVVTTMPDLMRIWFQANPQDLATEVKPATSLMR